MEQVDAKCYLRRMENPVVSIILPCYKAEHTLQRAIDSVEKQTFSDSFEVILVVRESGDNTLKIALAAQENNPERYRVISFDKQKGTGYSRLLGIKEAKGKYIYFLDADDELHPKCLSTLVETMEKENCDCLNCAFYVVRKGKKPKKDPFSKNKKMNGDEALHALFRDSWFRGFLWSKIFKREIFDHRPLLYLGECPDLFEDVALVTSLLSYCQSVVSIDEALYYHHKDNPLSATSSVRNDRTLMQIAVYALQRKFLEEQRGDAKKFLKHKFRMVLMLWFDYNCLDKKAGIDKDYKKRCKNAYKILFGKEKIKDDWEEYKDIFARAFLKGNIID